MKASARERELLRKILHDVRAERNRSGTLLIDSSLVRQIKRILGEE